MRGPTSWTFHGTVLSLFFFTFTSVICKKWSHIDLCCDYKFLINVKIKFGMLAFKTDPWEIKWGGTNNLRPYKSLAGLRAIGALYMRPKSTATHLIYQSLYFVHLVTKCLICYEEEIQHGHFFFWNFCLLILMKVRLWEKIEDNSWCGWKIETYFPNCISMNCILPWFNCIFHFANTRFTSSDFCFIHENP